MTEGDEDYVYDEDSGEWLPASELAAKQARRMPFEASDDGWTDEDLEGIDLEPVGTDDEDADALVDGDR